MDMSTASGTTSLFIRSSPKVPPAPVMKISCNTSDMPSSQSQPLVPALHPVFAVLIALPAAVTSTSAAEKPVTGPTHAMSGLAEVADQAAFLASNPRFFLHVLYASGHRDSCA